MCRFAKLPEDGELVKKAVANSTFEVLRGQEFGQGHGGRGLQGGRDLAQAPARTEGVADDLGKGRGQAVMTYEVLGIKGEAPLASSLWR